MSGETDNVIRLADIRPGHGARAVGQAAGAANVPQPDGLDDALWTNLLKMGGRLKMASCEIRHGQTDRIHASAYLWRIGQSMEDLADRADRLERKYRKAKKRAKRR